MRFLHSWWFPALLGMITMVMVLNKIFWPAQDTRVKGVSSVMFNENQEWVPPSEDEIPTGEDGDLIRYGKELIVNTSNYLGPKGIVSNVSNGMNCQNCHLNAGRVNYANPFSAVASGYPKYRHRSGIVESIEFRINDCMQRSLNGKPIDSTSTEMRAMVAYLKWIGKGVPKDFKPIGNPVEELPYLSRAADPARGQSIFRQKCVRCHGDNGQGTMLPDSSGYEYPPLWGPHSFNTGAGLFRLSRIACFIKNNMPFGASIKNPELTVEEAWDVAAFVVSQPRPEANFPNDWPDISKKPVDHPFGPFVDGLSEHQHKYGPFRKVKN